MAIAAVASGIATGGGLANLLLGVFPPLSTKYSQWAYSKWPNMIPGLGDLIELCYRNIIDFPTYERIAAQHGFDSDWAQKLSAGAAALLSSADYIRLWRRGVITEEETDAFLNRHHFYPEEIRLLKEATEYFPVPADLVRFAVREVYTPATVDRFGQMEDLPQKFIEEAAKAGVPEEQARNYWAAHWLLPSAGQGFEMFQRDVIPEADLDMLLKALDIMPFWRDKLTQIAYNTLTRVDVRRMHAMGNLDDTQTYDAYRHQGYSPNDAEKMLEFTKSYNSEGSKGLTRASVVKSFNDALINEGELRSYLQSFGYSEGVVDFWVDMAVYEKTVAEIHAAKVEADAQYRRGIIKEPEYRERLDAMDLPAAFVDAAVTETVATKSLKIRMPTKADLDKWLKLQVIDETYFASEMLNLGYRQEDVEFYLTENAMEIDTSKRKFLPVTTYARWLLKGILTGGDFRRIAGLMDISVNDINRLIAEVEAKKNESD